MGNYRGDEAGIIDSSDLVDVLCREGVVPHVCVHGRCKHQGVVLDVPGPHNACQQIVANTLHSIQSGIHG